MDDKIIEFEEPEEEVKYEKEYPSESVEDEIIEPDFTTPNRFCVRSSTGISINGVQFSKGVYRMGQLVGTLTIDRELMNSILSIDAQAIQSNPSSA